MIQPQLAPYYEQCASYCASAERCIADIYKKLATSNLTEEDKGQIIQKLIQEQFINEERYARFFIRDKYRFNRWGKIKIKFELKRKGISEDNIQQGMSEIDENEYIRIAYNLALSKNQKIKETNPYKRKAKLINFLSNKGFEYEIIENVLNQITQNQNEETDFFYPDYD